MKQLVQRDQRARSLERYGTTHYFVPFPMENIDDNLSLLYLMMKHRLPKASVVKIAVDSLVAIQNSVSCAGVRRYKRGDRNPILVARINGVNYIIDGTHRATAAWAMREPFVYAHYLEFRGLDLRHHYGGMTTSEWNALYDEALVK